MAHDDETPRSNSDDPRGIHGSRREAREAAMRRASDPDASMLPQPRADVLPDIAFEDATAADYGLSEPVATDDVDPAEPADATGPADDLADNVEVHAVEVHAQDAPADAASELTASDPKLEAPADASDAEATDAAGAGTAEDSDAADMVEPAAAVDTEGGIDEVGEPAEDPATVDDESAVQHPADDVMPDADDVTLDAEPDDAVPTDATRIDDVSADAEPAAKRSSERPQTADNSRTPMTFQTKVLIGALALIVAVGVVVAILFNLPKTAVPEATPTPGSSAEQGASDLDQAIAKAQKYSDSQHLSKQAIYDQLVNPKADNLSDTVAKEAVDKLEVDWNANALASAQKYAEVFHLSRAGVEAQLASKASGKFTADEVAFAMQNIQADWNNNALLTARSLRDSIGMTPEQLSEHLRSATGGMFTNEETDFALVHLDDAAEEVAPDEGATEEGAPEDGGSEEPAPEDGAPGDGSESSNG